MKYVGRIPAHSSRECVLAAFKSVHCLVIQNDAEKNDQRKINTSNVPWIGSLQNNNFQVIPSLLCPPGGRRGFWYKPRKPRGSTSRVVPPLRPSTTHDARRLCLSRLLWRFRSTFRPGNYIWSFSYGFGVVVRDIWEWRPGFYSEFRYKSYEHSGLAYGAIFWKSWNSTCFQGQWHFSRNNVPKLIQARKT